MDWLRWYHGTVTDAKWRVVAVEAGATVGEVVAVWACLVEHASQATPRGSLSGWRDKVVAMLLGQRPEMVGAIREAMQGLVLTGESLSGWEKRQPKYDHNATERKRRQREREAEEEGESHGMSRETNSVSRNVTTDKSREEKKTALSANAEKPSTIRGRQLPADWKPSEAHRVQAEDLGVSVDEEAEKFRDHHAARGSAMKDWEAAFRGWQRNARRFAPTPANGKRREPKPEIWDERIKGPIR